MKLHPQMYQQQQQQQKPDRTSAHFANASGFLSHGTWTQIELPNILSKLGLSVAAV